MGNRGKFIVLEGLDGCGKTTQLFLISQRLKQAGIPHITTREPSDGNPVGRLVREAVHGGHALENETLALLFAADRYQHARQEILPALERGEYVLCDRYYYSNLAYQQNNAADGLPPEHDAHAPETSGDYQWLLAYNHAAIQVCRPDCVIFIDTPPEECVRRMAGRDMDGLGIYENLITLRRVRRRFMDVIDLLSRREPIRVINDRGFTEEEMAEQIWAALGNYWE